MALQAPVINVGATTGITLEPVESGSVDPVNAVLYYDVAVRPVEVDEDIQYWLKFIHDVNSHIAYEGAGTGSMDDDAWKFETALSFGLGDVSERNLPTRAAFDYVYAAAGTANVTLNLTGSSGAYSLNIQSDGAGDVATGPLASEPANGATLDQATISDRKVALSLAADGTWTMSAPSDGANALNSVTSFNTSAFSVIENHLLAQHVKVSDGGSATQASPDNGLDSVSAVASISYTAPTTTSTNFITAVNLEIPVSASFDNTSDLSNMCRLYTTEGQTGLENPLSSGDKFVVGNYGYKPQYRDAADGQLKNVLENGGSGSGAITDGQANIHFVLQQS
jgi:hypothetical protein